jgi:hypothetical protein
MASGVRRLCLDATLGRYRPIGLVVRSVWIIPMDLEHGGLSRIAAARDTSSPAEAFTVVPAEHVPAPSCNRDRAPDPCVGADDVLQTTRFVAFDFASTRTGTLAFVEDAFITSSFESRILNCRLSEKHLNRRAARLVSCKKYLCEVRPGRAQAHLPTLPKTPRCHIEQPDARLRLDLYGHASTSSTVDISSEETKQGCSAT